MHILQNQEPCFDDVRKLDFSKEDNDQCFKLIACLKII